MKTPSTMSPRRSAELIDRFLGEHCDAYLLVGIRPDGQPIVRSRAGNPRDAIAVNAVASNVVMRGGIPVGSIETDESKGS